MTTLLQPFPPPPAAPAAVLHSANAGLIVHRAALVRNGCRAEGLDVAARLVDSVNAAMPGAVTAMLCEELFGVPNRLHWMLHMRQPHEYGRLLDLVEPRGRAWPAVFVAGSAAQTAMCPRHGSEQNGQHNGHGGQHNGHGGERGTSQPPGMAQAALTSANSAITVHRVARARHGARADAWGFLHEWAGQVNDGLAGAATALLYEEAHAHAVDGGLRRQDRLHLLIHLASLDSYLALRGLPGHDRYGLFADGSIQETAWTPHRRPRRQPRPHDHRNC